MKMLLFVVQHVQIIYIHRLLQFKGLELGYWGDGEAPHTPQDRIDQPKFHKNKYTCI